MRFTDTDTIERVVRKHLLVREDNRSDDRGALVYYCSGPGCCTSRNELIEHITSALQATVFGTCMPVPMLSRWSKVTDCLLWMQTGFSVCNILGMVFKEAFNPDKQGEGIVSDTALIMMGQMASTAADDQAIVPVDGAAEPPDDPEFDAGTKFFAVVGARLAKALAFMEEHTSAALTSLFVAVLVPMQNIFHWHLAAQASASDDDMLGYESDTESDDEN